MGFNPTAMDQVISLVTSLGPLLLMGAVFYPKRQELRAKLGGTNQNTPMDFCVWCCSILTPCAICQEAREIDRATGVRVDCCCNLSAVGGGPGGVPMVGQAVMAPGQL